MNDLDHKNQVTPRTKIDLNLRLAKDTSYLPTKRYSIKDTLKAFDDFKNKQKRV